MPAHLYFCCWKAWGWQVSDRAQKDGKNFVPIGQQRLELSSYDTGGSLVICLLQAAQPLCKIGATTAGTQAGVPQARMQFCGLIGSSGLLWLAFGESTAEACSCRGQPAILLVMPFGDADRL